MTGPEHYAQAEYYINAAQEWPNSVTQDSNLRFAQVHATLALVAATALQATGPGIRLQSWNEALR